MNYKIEDIEDQLIATLRADTNLSGVTIETHAGQISANYFLNAEYKEGLILRLPIIFVRYSGRTLVESDSVNWTNQYELHFQFFVCEKSLRSRKEAERSAYATLRSIYDGIHGHWPYSTQALATSLNILTGTQITTSDFIAVTPFITQGGEDEQFVVDLPGLVVYRSDYKIDMIA